jgi:ribosomal protein S21
MSKKSTHVNVKVDARNFENFERMLKRFMKKVKKERIIEQVKERRYYEKPSVTELKAKLNGIKKEKKRVREFNKKINSNDKLNSNRDRGNR